MRARVMPMSFGVVLGGVLAAAAVGCGGGDAQPASALRAVDGRLRDRDDREVLLRGVNARVRGLFDVTFADGRAPLEEIPSFGEADCQFLAEELGFDHLRLPINWSAVEPAPGAYQAAYVDQVVALAAACDRHGVKTVVDFHQDAFSKEIGEDGAPLWAIQPAPTMLLEGPLDDLAARRMSPQVVAAFRTFFDDSAGGWDAFAGAVAFVAERIDGRPGVVGLELFNEPYILFDDDTLVAFHQHVAARLRAVAPGLAVFFEPAALRNITDDDAANPPIGIANAVYAPHVYVDVFEDGWVAEDVPKLDASVAGTRREATAHGAALYVGEFGHDDSALGGRYVAAALAAFDRERASWAYWLYEEWSQGGWGLYDQAGGGRGAVREVRAALLARAYPVAVDGTLASVGYEPASRQLTVVLDGAGGGTHEVAVPRITYPAGVAVTCDGAAVAVTATPGRATFGCGGRTVVVSPLP